MITIVILGAGNVATQLYKAFDSSKEISVIQWYNRNIKCIPSCDEKVVVTDTIETLIEADLYIIAVSDDHIAELSSKLPFEDRLVVHTSGSVGIHDMDKKNRRGVFYPLQTFSKNTAVDFSTIPICLETLEKADYHLLKSVASAISDHTKRVNSEQRAALHLAAVFVNNFTNQLYRVAQEITESKSTEFDLLKPLIFETAKKVQELSPYRAQTGPAKRNDKKTIKRHLKLLENEHHKEIYQLLTESIKKTHGR